jgi:hypothetical protein
MLMQWIRHKHKDYCWKWEKLGIINCIAVHLALSSFPIQSLRLNALLGRHLRKPVGCKYDNREILLDVRLIHNFGVFQTSDLLSLPPALMII